MGQEESAAAELDLWLKPSVALARLPDSLDDQTKKQAIKRRLVDGSIPAAARAGVFNDSRGIQRIEYLIVESHFWRDPWNSYDHDFWTIGDLTFDDAPPTQMVYVFSVDDPPEGERLIRNASFKDVRLDPEAFDREFGHLTAVQTGAGGEAGESVSARGKPLSDAILRQWYDLFKAAYPSGSIELARRSVAGMFPDHHVSRDRIRELFPNRTPGRPRKSKDNP